MIFRHHLTFHLIMDSIITLLLWMPFHDIFGYINQMHFLFQQFEAMTETQFDTKLESVQIDWGV